MADRSVVANLGTIAVQGVGVIATGVVSAAVTASIILGGNVITDSSRNAAPSLVYDSGSYLTYQMTPIVASGANVMVARHQLASTFQSGGVLQRFSVECGDKSLASTGSVVIQDALKRGITVGDVQRQFIWLQTGSLTQSNTGTLFGKKLYNDYYISFVGASGSALRVNGDCVFKTWTHAKYGR